MFVIYVKTRGSKKLKYFFSDLFITQYTNPIMTTFEEEIIASIEGGVDESHFEHDFPSVSDERISSFLPSRVRVMATANHIRKRGHVSPEWAAKMDDMTTQLHKTMNEEPRQKRSYKNDIQTLTYREFVQGMRDCTLAINYDTPLPDYQSQGLFPCRQVSWRFENDYMDTDTVYRLNMFLFVHRYYLTKDCLTNAIQTHHEHIMWLFLGEMKTMIQQHEQV